MTQPSPHSAPPTSDMNATNLDEAQSLLELLHSLIGEAVEWRRTIKYTNSRKPTPTEVEQKLSSTASLFRTRIAPSGDLEINTAVATEKEVVIAWLNELLRAANSDQLARLTDPQKRRQRQQQAQLFSYWRAYQSFVGLRLKAMRKMPVETARKFMVSRVAIDPTHNVHFARS